MRHVYCREDDQWEWRQAAPVASSDDFPLVEKAKLLVTAIGLTAAGYLFLVALLVR